MDSASAQLRRPNADKLSGRLCKPNLRWDNGVDVAKNTIRKPPVKVLLDYRDLGIPAVVKTVQDLLIHIQTEVLPRDRVIQHIVIDGEYLTEEAEASAHNMRLDKFENVELHTRKVIELALEGLEHALEIVPAVAEDLLAASTDLRSGNIREGMNILHDCLTMVEWYIDLTSAIEALFLPDKPWLRNRGLNGRHLDKNGDEGKGPPYVSFEDKDGLLAKFEDLERAQEADDFVGAADLIEFELQPVVGRWAKELPEILSRVKAERAEA